MADDPQCDAPLNEDAAAQAEAEARQQEAEARQQEYRALLEQIERERLRLNRYLRRSQFYGWLIPVIILTVVCLVVVVLDPDALVGTLVAWLVYVGMFVMGNRMIGVFQRLFGHRPRPADPVVAPPEPPPIPMVADDGYYGEQYRLGQHRHAEARAAILFDRLLTPKEQQQWRSQSRVRIDLQHGRWAVLGSGRVEWWDHHSQCVLPRFTTWVPREDVLIGQLLHLRNDPDGLRLIGGLSRVTSKFGPRPPPRASRTLREAFRRLDA